MSKKALTLKRRKNYHILLRTIIQLLFLIFFPSAFTSAFSGIKYLCTQIGAAKAINLTAFITVLFALCAFTIIFGRFFCGYACAFGTVGDAIRAVYVWICKRVHKKPLTIPEKIARYLKYLKYIVLLAIVVFCFLGVYGEITGWSPWDVFSMILSGNFHFTGYVVGIILLIAIGIGMALCDRFFCRFLCPMGAIFSLLPVLPFFTVQRKKENCLKGCRACEKACPCAVNVPETGSVAISGECIQCKKCARCCPQKGKKETWANCQGDRFLGGLHEYWITAGEAIVLAIVMILAGV